jgi:hypothetical protein
MTCPASPSSTAMLTAWTARLVGPNSGPVVVAVLAELVGDRAGDLQVLVGLAAPVVPGRRDGQDQVRCPTQGQHLRFCLRGDLGFQGVGGADRDVVCLVDLAQGQEHVGHPENAGRDGQR